MNTTLGVFLYKESVVYLIRRVFPNTNHYNNGDESFIYTSHEGEGYNVAFPKDLSYLMQKGLEPHHLACCMTNQLVNLIIEGDKNE
ncbi:MAG: hypothetical protein GOVbin2917_111 [Prokaryotic dsDNA virus sp.]|jgi:hypothetical protein|nr:MAG: hypothetical protein GOVbin2917_111 [Prokaryotic dsDNA virus sp.]|tara:strand:- start:32598 stop:32855 length:258 start_codon:yes stop_codon:yes gene_type:complete